MTQRVTVLFVENTCVVQDGSGKHTWYFPLLPEVAREHVERNMLRMYELGRNDRVREIAEASAVEPTSF